jgi:hypothetical protein
MHIAESPKNWPFIYLVAFIIVCLLIIIRHNNM